jgi:hypothetical protein
VGVMLHPNYRLENFSVAGHELMAQGLAQLPGHPQGGGGKDQEDPSAQQKGKSRAPPRASRTRGVRDA